MPHRLGKVFTNTNSSCIFEAAFIATVLERTRFILMKRNLDNDLLDLYAEVRRSKRLRLRFEGGARTKPWYHEMIDLMAAKFPNTVG